MKNFPLFSIFFLLFISIPRIEIIAQTATETLDASNSKITLNGTGLWGFNIDSEPNYQWPRNVNSQGPSPGLIFSGNLWFGGVNNDGDLKLAVKTTGTNTNSFRSGPLNAEGSISIEDSENWNRQFKVDKAEIEAFQADFMDNQQLDDPIPASILGWPGRDNPFFSTVHGFELPNTSAGLAPFFDLDGDAVYDPNDGDYPLIKCADQAVWWVFNDMGNNSAIRMKMETQILAYVYNSNISNIYNSSFYDVKHIYYGTEPLDSTFFGIWLDPDLGCGEDDYIGCVPDENLAYVYNSDAVDGFDDGTCNGISTYEEAPILGLKLLEGPLNDQGERLGMTSLVHYINGGSIPTPPANIVDPLQANQFYKYMTGRKLDGSPYLNPANQPTNFVFSDNPGDTPAGWSMCSEELSPIDVRILMSMGPMRLIPGAVNNMTFAVVVQPQAELPCPDISDLIAAADLPVPNNEPGNLFCGLTVDTDEVNLLSTNLSVFPNPGSDQVNFLLSGSDSFITIRLYQMNGKLVRKEDNLNSTNILLERNELPSGTYIYQVQTQSGNSFNGKIILE